MRIKNSSVYLFLACSLLACNSNTEPRAADTNSKTIQFTEPVVEREVMAEASAVSLVKSVNEEAANKTTQPAFEKHSKIIKDGSISVETKDSKLCKQRFDALVNQYKAYYENEVFENLDYEERIELKIRIPSANFEKFITAIEKGNDELTGKQIEARDVSESYADAELRLENKKAYLKRYVALLAKASSIKDVLEIEAQIQVLQEEIESKEGTLRYLNDQLAYSTLRLTISCKKEFIYKPEHADSFWQRLKKAFNSSWSHLLSFILWLVELWPVILLLVGLVYGFRFFKNRFLN